MRIVEKIKKIMEYYSWNQQELANHLHVAKSQVTRWLSGEQIPSGENYSKIDEEFSKIAA